MNKKHYYQLVRTYGKYDLEYVVHAARKDKQNNIEISAIPFVLVGNHPQEITDTLQHIAKDVKENPPVDKQDCDIYHENLYYEDEDYVED